ncbi:MAG: hypothetical protein QOF87_2570, partial [Pseudonocardiales bacterium]|nr:hypothetical protein [Pseudonocardiales bacterium]
TENPLNALDFSNMIIPSSGVIDAYGCRSTAALNDPSM